MSGGEFVSFNNAVFLSERENADRNYALAFYMRENKCFPEKINLRECLDFYFQVINFKHLNKFSLKSEIKNTPVQYYLQSLVVTRQSLYIKLHFVI